MAPGESRRQWPIRVGCFGLRHDAVDEWIKVLLANIAPAQDALDRGANSGLDIFAVRLGPIDLEVLLDRLDHIVNQIPQERPVVKIPEVGGDDLEEGEFFGRQAKFAARCSSTSQSRRICNMTLITAAASMSRLWYFRSVSSSRSLNDLDFAKNRPHENLSLKLLEKLLQDEIQARRRKNLKGLQELVAQDRDVSARDGRIEDVHDAKSKNRGNVMRILKSFCKLTQNNAISCIFVH